MTEHGNYRFIVRSLDLANYLTTQKGFEIKSVRDDSGNSNYKVFFFDDSEELRQAVDIWINLKKRGDVLYADERKEVFKGCSRGKL